MAQSRDKAEKAHAQATVFCERLGRYRMPFAWTAIYLMNILDGISSLEREAGDRDVPAAQTNSLERKSSQSSLDQFRRSRPGAGEGGSGPGSGPGSGLGRRGSLERRSFSERRGASSAQLAQSLQTFRPVTLTVSTFFRQVSGDATPVASLLKGWLVKVTVKSTILLLTSKILFHKAKITFT
ncbi:Dedicator of cytokinesis protein 7 [Amphibalanus amphitrite]|uniref:Dedicator of cytokinesis protein 7 n=1 Tax=Amphibalanus amphitrite TaxID=1232801 RepID=A0A6A4W4U5_AMPAM|nr:Dedicator of cytokinesis protein 7 [Amphibalanus amphitrite]